MKEKSWLKSPIWPEEVPKSIKYPEVQTDEFLKNTAQNCPDRLAIIFQGEKITYSELDDLTDRFATGLSEIGVEKEDVVAIMMPNCPQFPIAYYGSLRIGAVVTPVSPLHSEREVEYQLKDAGAETIVTLDLELTYPKVRKIASKIRLKRVITSKMSEYLPINREALSKLIDLAEVEEDDWSGTEVELHRFKKMIKNPPEPPSVNVNPREDTAVLAYTGGTTGLPKGVMLTHYNRSVNITQVAAWLAPALNEEEIPPEPSLEDYPSEEEMVSITVVPWFHAMGMLGYLDNPIASGSTMVVLPRFDPTEYLEAVKKYEADTLGGAPPIFVPLLEHPNFDKYRESFGSVRLCGSGAAPLPVEHLKRLRKIIKGVVMEAYGLTECTMGAIFNPTPSDAVRKVGSVGIPISDIDAKIVDIETGEKELEMGEEGELCIKGPNIMKGYLNNPEETNEVLRNGWLYTGDIAKMDEDGYFYIVDRKKDMLIYKGYNVYPRELEEVLYEHPAVERCAVIGKPVEEVGEIPKAFIELKKGKETSEEEIIDFVNKRVGLYKKIREVEFLEEIPVSVEGKTLRRELREREKTSS